tara:strand:- start:7193 stop:7486 length:294 start_codon:yes stop_codon:yes gene_type:complete
MYTGGNMSNVYDNLVFPYTDRENASITLKRLDAPHGPGSPTVLSLGCSLKGKPDEPTWVVHLPMDLVPSIANSMQVFHEMEQRRKQMADTSTAAPGF